MDHLIFEEGGGGGGSGRIFLRNIFFSHWPVFLFTVKTVPPLPPKKVKWSAPNAVADHLPYPHY